MIGAVEHRVEIRAQQGMLREKAQIRKIGVDPVYQRFGIRGQPGNDVPELKEDTVSVENPLGFQQVENHQHHPGKTCQQHQKRPSSLLRPVVALVEKQEGSKHHQLNYAGNGEGAHHGERQNSADNPGFPGLVPSRRIMVQVKPKNQEILVDPRLPEQSEIPVPVRLRARKAQTEVIEPHTRRIDPDLRLEHVSPDQVPQAIGGKQRIGRQRRDDHQVGFRHPAAVRKIGQEHRKHRAHRNTQVHHLPVPLEKHDEQIQAQRDCHEHHPSVCENLPQMMPVHGQKGKPRQHHHRQHGKLRRIKSQPQGGNQGVPGQKQQGKQHQPKGGRPELAFGKRILFHKAFPPVSSSMAPRRCSGPRGTAIPP